MSFIVKRLLGVAVFALRSRCTTLGGVPARVAGRENYMDVLSEVLRSLRVNASIYCAMDLSAPWGISLPKSSWAPFHFLESGSCWLLRDGRKRVRLDAGDLVVLFNCQGHRLCDVPGTRPEALDRVIRHKSGQGTVSFGGGGALTRLICGKFALDEREGPPGSLRHLPELLHVRLASWQQFASFSAALRLLSNAVRSQQPGGELAARFLTEVLLIQVLRVLVNGRGATARGWLQGIRDPPIAAALAAIHAKPGHAWSLESLAVTAGLSRSVFAARFRERVGQSPMAYGWQCRLRPACQWLEETDLSRSDGLSRFGS